MSDNSKQIAAEMSTAVAVVKIAFRACNKHRVIPPSMCYGEELADTVLENRGLMALARSADGTVSAAELVQVILDQAFEQSQGWPLLLQLARAGIKLLEVKE
jgi:hypothetical protein